MALILRARSLVRGSGVVRSSAIRRMCTAIAEEAPAPGTHFSPVDPTNAAFYGSVVLCYLFTLRWQSRDRALAKEIAAAKEAKAKETAAAAPPPEPEAAVMAGTTAPTSAIVRAVVSAPVGASPADWKTADVAAWLESIELPEHAASFKAHSVNGKMLLALSDQDMYQSLGITSPLHRKKLLMEISALRKSYLGQ